MTQVLTCHPEPLRINALILDIWSLAEEFDCAVLADQVLRQMRGRARATCTATIGRARPA